MLEAARLDLDWHSLPATAPRQDVDKFEAQALANSGFDVADVPPRYRSSYFLHIWSNGYSAGYYAYPWTRMLAQDAFAWFENARRPDPRQRPALPRHGPVARQHAGSMPRCTAPSPATIRASSRISNITGFRLTPARRHRRRRRHLLRAGARDRAAKGRARALNHDPPARRPDLGERPDRSPRGRRAGGARRDDAGQQPPRRRGCRASRLPARSRPRPTLRGSLTASCRSSAASARPMSRRCRRRCARPATARCSPSAAPEPGRRWLARWRIARKARRPRGRAAG